MPVRDCLSDDLTAARRMRLHRRVGEALERLLGAASPAELAHRFFEAAPAGVDARADRTARAAAEEAARLRAYEEAGRRLEMALAALQLSAEPDDPTRCELLLAAVTARGGR